MRSLSLSHDQHAQPTLIPLRNAKHFILRQIKIHFFLSFVAIAPSGPKPPHSRGF